MGILQIIIPNVVNFNSGGFDFNALIAMDLN